MFFYFLCLREIKPIFIRNIIVQKTSIIQKQPKKVKKMSRRTRISRDIRKHKIGLNHHSQYSQSTTYYPDSYSLFGTPISMPAPIFPFIQGSKLSHICKQKQLLSPQCPLNTLVSSQSQSLPSLKAVNLTLSGQVIQKDNNFASKCLFFISMALCCLLACFAYSGFRRRFFTRYRIDEEEYKKLADLLKEMKGCESLVINFQDNQFNEEKGRILEDAIIAAMGAGQATETEISMKPIKKVTIRNFCYYMSDIDIKRVFKNLMHQQGIEMTFIWEKKILTSKKLSKSQSQSQSLLGPIFGY